MTFFTAVAAFLVYGYPLSNLIGGAAIVLAFAPWSWYPLAFLVPALALFLWSRVPPGRAFRHGYLFGFTYSLASVYWVYYSLHDYGGAGIIFASLAVVLFAALLALYYAVLACVVSHGFRHFGGWRAHLLLFPGAWVLLEWVRATVVFGFPWNILGQALVDSPLSPVLPVVGVHGASFIAAFCAGVLALAFSYNDNRRRAACALALTSVLALSILPGRIEWTAPAGEPVRFAVIQSNVDQKIKFDRRHFDRIVGLYREATSQSLGRQLIVWPETALPGFVHQLEESVFTPMREQLEDAGSHLLAGAFYRDFEGGGRYNSVMNVNDRSFYHKRRLVPFGEYIPSRGLLKIFSGLIMIPMSDLDAAENEPLIAVGGHRVGVSICYESAFAAAGRDSLPDADYLVNVSNDSWFGRSNASPQLLQITRVRAAEAGRALLRAAGTGISAVIDAHGRVVAATSLFERRTLTGEIKPRQGATPYVRWGDWPALGLSLLLVLLSYATGLKTAQQKRRDAGEQPPSGKAREEEAVRRERSADGENDE